MINEPPAIAGAGAVVEWFGYWPSFHDAEVLRITLDRSGRSEVAIYVFERTSETGTRGDYLLTKHAIVTFTLDGFALAEEGIVNTEIRFFNYQNVLSGCAVQRIPGGYALVLNGIFGVAGSVCCEHMSVKVEPAAPHDNSSITIDRA